MTLFLRSVGIDPKIDAGYAENIPAVAALRKRVLDLQYPVVFLVGENGSGKSTLLNALAEKCGFPTEGGTKNFNFSTCETDSPLIASLVLARGTSRERDGFFLRAESFFNVATEIDRLDKVVSVPLLPAYGGLSLHTISHGESFMALAKSRFGANSLFFLDEPEAALSASRQLALLLRIHELTEQNCQFVIATHSPILTAFPDACIYELSESGIERVSYEQTENYRITSDFLTNPKRMLRHLLSEE